MAAVALARAFEWPIPAGAALWPARPARPPARGHAERRRAYDLGVSSEAVVSRFLLAGGYHIIGRRERIGAAEVDIIAVRDDVVAFVEVKARRRGWDGLESVTARKQAQIVKAANAWIAEHPAFASCAIRFDVALIWPSGEIEYLESAFEAREEFGYAW